MYISKLRCIYFLYLKNKIEKSTISSVRKGFKLKNFIFYKFMLHRWSTNCRGSATPPPPIHYKFGPEGCKVQRYYDKKYKEECPFFQVWTLKYNFSNILYIPTNKSKNKYLISLLKLSNIVKSSKSLKDKFILFDNKTTI